MNGISLCISDISFVGKSELNSLLNDLNYSWRPPIFKEISPNSWIGVIRKDVEKFLSPISLNIGNGIGNYMICETCMIIYTISRSRGYLVEFTETFVEKLYEISRRKESTIGKVFEHTINWDELEDRPLNNF